MKQTAEERHLDKLAIGIIRVRQDHFAAESLVRTVMVPVFKKFHGGKPNLLSRPEYDLVQAFRFQGADEVFTAGVHHRAERRPAAAARIIAL